MLCSFFSVWLLDECLVAVALKITWLLLLLCALWAYIGWTQLHLLLIRVDYGVFLHVRVRLAGSQYLQRRWSTVSVVETLTRFTKSCAAMAADRSHDTGEAPLCAEESVAVQAALVVQVAFKHVHSDDVRVHGVGILPHGRLDHWLPRVTACKDTEEGRQTVCVLSWIIVSSGMKVFRKGPHDEGHGCCYDAMNIVRSQ